MIIKAVGNRSERESESKRESKSEAKKVKRREKSPRALKKFLQVILIKKKNDLSC